MSGKVFIGIYKTGLRLTGYGVMAVGIGIAALAYTRLVRELNDHNHHDYMFDGLFWRNCVTRCPSLNSSTYQYGRVDGFSVTSISLVFETFTRNITVPRLDTALSMRMSSESGLSPSCRTKIRSCSLPMTPTCNLYTIFNTSFPADGGLILICTLQPTGGGKGHNVRENHMNNHATDTANGLLLLGSHAYEQRWHEVEQLWREAQTCYEAWMAAHRIHIHTVCAHHQLQKAAEMDEDPITDDTDTKPTAAERAAYFAARDHADDTDTPGTPGRRPAVRIVAYDAHKGGCHEVDPTDVPVWLLDTPNTAIARAARKATLQEIRTLIDDLIDGPDERGERES